MAYLDFRKLACIVLHGADKLVIYLLFVVVPQQVFTLRKTDGATLELKTLVPIALSHK